MSTKLEILSLPDGQKEPENGYLSQLVHLLHEHTIDTIQDRPQTVVRFISMTERRSSTSRILRSIVENSATDQFQLKILSELEDLRSEIENIHRDRSVPKYCSFIRSLDVTFKKLEELITCAELQERLSSADLEAFEQFGGVFILLDILFLDRQFRDLGPEFVLIADTKCSFQVRQRVFLLLDGLIYHSKEARALFNKNQTLLSLLADTYRSSSDKKSWLIRKKIANIFESLGSRDGLFPANNTYDYRPCGIVRDLTESAIRCHADLIDEDGRSEDELTSTLGALSALIRQKHHCRQDFMAIEGSMDLLIDLFGERRESDPDYPFLHKGNRYDWVLDCVPSYSFVKSYFLLFWPSFIVLFSILGLILRSSRLERLNCSGNASLSDEIDASFNFDTSGQFNFSDQYNTSGQFDSWLTSGQFNCSLRFDQFNDSFTSGLFNCSFTHTADSWNNCTAIFDSWNFFSDRYINSFWNVYALKRDFLWAVEGITLPLIIITVTMILTSRCLSRQCSASPQLKHAADLLIYSASAFHKEPRVLERLRQRDFCALLVLYLNARPLHNDRYYMAANIIGNMVRWRDQLPADANIEIERKRLIELGAVEKLKEEVNNCRKIENLQKANWLPLFMTILEYLKE